MVDRQIELVKADYLNPQHAAALGSLLSAYALDPMGGGIPLPDNVRTDLAPALACIPHAFSVLCYVDGEAAGLINGFEGFSTFACKPLLNIHDIVVLADFRGLGLSQRLLQYVEELAVAKGCCKLTLEVLEGNKVAQGSYLKFGFDGYKLNAETGKALFWQKKL